MLTVAQLIEQLQNQPPHQLVAVAPSGTDPILADGDVRQGDLDDGDYSPVVVIR